MTSRPDSCELRQFAHTLLPRRLYARLRQVEGGQWGFLSKFTIKHYLQVHRSLNVSVPVCRSRRLRSTCSLTIVIAPHGCIHACCVFRRNNECHLQFHRPRPRTVGWHIRRESRPVFRRGVLALSCSFGWHIRHESRPVFRRRVLPHSLNI